MEDYLYSGGPVVDTFNKDLLIDTIWETLTDINSIDKLKAMVDRFHDVNSKYINEDDIIEDKELIEEDEEKLESEVTQPDKYNDESPFDDAWKVFSTIHNKQN